MRHDRARVCPLGGFVALALAVTTSAAAGPAAPAGPAMDVTNVIELAKAIGGTHYMAALQAGTPYQVLDEKTGAMVTVDQPVLVIEKGDKPRTYATGANEVHAICTAPVVGGADKALLDYTLTWDPNYENWDGSKGMYTVQAVVVFELKGQARYTFTRKGKLFVRKRAW